MADEEELARLERKRLKKLAKKQARLQVASGAEEEAVEEPTGDNPDADADAAARKQAKREKKRRRAEEEAALNAEAALLSSGEKVAKKASHGQDGLQHGGATTPAALANVGDHSAAATGSRFRKAFYTECAELAALSQAEARKHREKLQITVEAEPTGNIYKPVRSFEEAGFPQNVLAACSDFTKPSPIQSQCWPIVMRGRDLIGIAATGSGKTLAFMLPALVHIEAQPRAGPNEPIVLVLAPTRELAMQTAEVTDKVGSPCGVHCACIYGGAPKGPQYAALRNGAQVVVATPGRLQDLFDEGAVSFKRVTYLTLDEADRMLDLGFEPAIRSLAGAVRADRQTLMFSATWPISIQGLASEFLCSPVMVRIGSDGTRASHSITQVVEVLESDARDGRLEQLLMQYQGGKQAQRRCIIFVLYKKEATRVAEWLRRRGWNAREIQGDMPQKQRTDTVAAFKQGTMPLLIATDVAARGLDIPGVETVINYSFPLTIEDYVHRIGRTGRAGATGVAHTFFCQQDKSHAGELANVLREAGHAVPPELTKFGTHVKKKESKLYGAHFKEVDTRTQGTKITFDDD